MIFVFTFSCFCKVDWCTVDSHLSGCFCLLAPHFWEGGRDLQMMLYSLAAILMENPPSSMFASVLNTIVTWFELLLTTGRRSLLWSAESPQTESNNSASFESPGNMNIKWKLGSLIFNKFLSVFVSQNIQSIFKQKTKKLRL